METHLIFILNPPIILQYVYASMPPLAFIEDEEEEGAVKASGSSMTTTATGSNVGNSDGSNKAKTKKKGRRALSASMTELPSSSSSLLRKEQQEKQGKEEEQGQKRRARPQSVGGMPRRRLSLQSITNTIEIAGADGKKRLMNHVRLSLHNQEEGSAENVLMGQTSVFIPVSDENVEHDQVEEQGEHHKATPAAGQEEEGQQQQQQHRRCQSVTVSLEPADELPCSTSTPPGDTHASKEANNAGAEEGGEEGELKKRPSNGGGEEALNLEIEQSEAFKVRTFYIHNNPFAFFLKNPSPLTSPLTNTWLTSPLFPFSSFKNLAISVWNNTSSPSSK